MTTPPHAGPTAPGPTPGPDGDVGAVVALKAGEHVKSRLAPIPQPLRRRLAWTMALDTLAALVDAVATVCVVSDQPSLQDRLSRAGLGTVQVVPEGRPAGMNEALRLGADHLRRSDVPRVLAVVGDLPALRPTSVRTVVAGAAAYERAYVADATGVGTTMLLATAGVGLGPRFQGRSAAAHHHSGAVALTDERLGATVPHARRDVDTEVDLADAAGLGLGPATRALLDPRTGRLGAYAVVTTVDAPARGTVPEHAETPGHAVTTTGVRVLLPPGRVADGLRLPRPGQRLHCVLAGGEVLSAWL
ncbi:2-phospho-L-lactate guanylyltransferase [Microlunatus sagamiharensis]|uniref:2-phospho-L-lactate guanylyltransferase n=1 Tax=Microlunatus sagamiharensis TaxID=546874 RepID=A0A1H2LXY3_9ACTN|nr:2-phospho-L-lactate guanylyltransferase [Microlunatus sagamiharensis]SDU85789.1 2-phospho-L-lactate guanylyltransferase [Microlunatus sagamiharensis]